MNTEQESTVKYETRYFDIFLSPKAFSEFAKGEAILWSLPFLGCTLQNLSHNLDLISMFILVTSIPTSKRIVELKISARIRTWKVQFFKTALAPKHGSFYYVIIMLVKIKNC